MHFLSFVMIWLLTWAICGEFFQLHGSLWRKQMPLLWSKSLLKHWVGLLGLQKPLKAACKSCVRTHWCVHPSIPVIRFSKGMRSSKIWVSNPTNQDLHLSHSVDINRVAQYKTWSGLSLHCFIYLAKKKNSVTGSFYVSQAALYYISKTFLEFVI